MTAIRDAILTGIDDRARHVQDEKILDIAIKTTQSVLKVLELNAPDARVIVHRSPRSPRTIKFTITLPALAERKSK